jgi:hypothetical protein
VSSISTSESSSPAVLPRPLAAEEAPGSKLVGRRLLVVVVVPALGLALALGDSHGYCSQILGTARRWRR